MVIGIFYYVLTAVLLFTGISSLLGKNIPKKAQERLEPEALRRWAVLRGLGCLAAVPAFFCIAYMQKNPIPAYAIFIVGVLMIVALFCILFANKYYLRDFMGK